MPQPGEPSPQQRSAEESFLDLLADTLEALDESTRGQFLRQYFHTLAQIELTESEATEYWRQILLRKGELNASLDKKVSLRAAIVDVLSSASVLRVPILIEYEDLKKLQINAATDPLTGLYNRRLFDEYCEKELNRAKRYNHHLAVVILDLHKLKEVNDRHGHQRGDQVIQLAASTLRKTLRASDFAFRIGGDEFALLLPQTDPEQAVTLCHRVRAQYENEVSPLRLDVAITLDFGVAVHPDDGNQKSELLRIADERLYELKYSTRAQPRVTPLEPSAPQAAPPATNPFTAPQPNPTPQAPSPGRAASASAGAGPKAASMRSPEGDQRKWERVSLTGTKAHAVLSDINLGHSTAKVVDLSYGGVALEFESLPDLPNQFSAVLHVPILPPVRVILRKAYMRQTKDGQVRVGCSFVS
jgi:diguanylate cyclase (GGDEF)-like protein